MTPKKSVILLHGATGAADQLEPLAGLLRELGFDVHSFSFSGHGQVPFGSAFGIAAFAEELKTYIASHGLYQPYVFGYSMGGYVALYLAVRHPELMGSIATLATKYHWTVEGAAKEVRMLDADTITQKVPAFAAALQNRHGDNWPQLLQRTADMMLELGSMPMLDDTVLETLTQRVMVGLGDRDNMVSPEETLQLFHALPDACMYMLPATGHPIEKANIPLLAQVLHQFFNR